MYEYLVIFACLAGVILVTFVTNGIQLFKESKQLQISGKTPLTYRNLAVIFLAAIAEIVVVHLTLMSCIALEVPLNQYSVFFIFVGAYLLRNIGAYLTAWAIWSIFVKIDRRKMMKEIEKDKEKAL